jgi:SAM-dependent methyltransferase
MGAETAERTEFWGHSQPGFKFSSAEPGTRPFYEEVTQHRYALEPHIPEMARFREWKGRDVLDVGCGVATDGAEFARAGARYVGLDGSPLAIQLAQRRFELYDLPGDFVEGDATALPFEDNHFDLVWSHGVIHHFPDTDKAVTEFRRVLRPGGVALVMLYHRGSFNYHFTIMGVRRLLAASLVVPGAVGLISRVTGEEPEVLRAHRALLKRYGRRYLVDRQLFLNHNTDGPGNPLSRVFSRREAQELFSGFANVSTSVRYLSLRIYPAGARLARTSVAQTLGARFGWHLYVRAQKPHV